MDKLPWEIAVEIAEYCDVSSLILLRQTSKRWLKITESVLRKVEVLDLAKHIEPIFVSGGGPVENWRRTDALFTYIGSNIPTTKTIVINSGNIMVSHSNFLKIALELPMLECLELHQHSHTAQISHNILYCLEAFQNLKSLKIGNWGRVCAPGNGCSHRSTIPAPKLLSLEHLSLRGNHVIFHVLENLRRQRERGALRTLEVIFNEPNPMLMHTVTWFLREYKEGAVSLLPLKIERDPPMPVVPAPVEEALAILREDGAHKQKKKQVEHERIWKDEEEESSDEED